MRKEFREYRRNRFIIYTMGTLPLIFTALPVISLFSISNSEDPSTVKTQVAITLLLLLVIPVVLPATIAAYSVIGERDQGTLEHSLRRRSVEKSSCWANPWRPPFQRWVSPTRSLSCWSWQFDSGLRASSRTTSGNHRGSWRNCSSRHCWRPGPYGWERRSRLDRQTCAWHSNSGPSRACPPSSCPC